VIKIYNGIELDEYRPNGKEVRSQKSEVRGEFGITKDVPVIGAIGRMVWQKGFEYLIQAIPDIVRDVPDAKFLLVGDGPLRESLEALSKELRVRDKVIFTGFRSDIKEILSAIDILVIPSLLEGFPMITLEAMAMAKPIVATNIDGITEQTTDGVNGILVPPQNPSVLAKAVVRVLNDKELARTMGLSAREKVEQEFSVEKMVAETEKVYLSLLRAN
jgi:glycosyltransferase involved in cell wall biosynthesis